MPRFLPAFIAVPLCILPLTAAQIALAQKPVAPPAPKTASTSPDPAVRQSTVPKILEAISKAYRISIVTDAFPFDDRPDYFVPITGSHENEDPLKALQEVTERYQMEVSQRNGLYVVRHKKWAVYYKGQQATPPVWKGQNPLSITRLDKPYEGITFTTADAPDANTPAQHIDINGTAISVARLAIAFEEINWTVHVDRNVSARRVNVYAYDVSPSAILGAVTFLVNASEEVSIKAVPAQVALENYDGMQFSNKMRSRVGPSDALRADMEKLLTKEQKAEMDNGKFVSFRLGDLPPDLQKRALNYANLAANLDRDVVAPPDPSKWQNFRIRFRPNEPTWLDTRTLSVVTVAADGTEYFF